MTRRETITFVVATKIALVALVVFFHTTMTNHPPVSPHGWLERWNRWDAPHYIDIARDGYVTEDVHTPNQKYWIVFYPLYPWTIRFLSIIVRGCSWTGGPTAASAASGSGSPSPPSASSSIYV